MSLFDKDIIYKDLEYDPDPKRNIRIQIRRKICCLLDTFNREYNQYKFNIPRLIKYNLDNYLYDLQTNNPPYNWVGPYMKIQEFTVIENYDDPALLITYWINDGGIKKLYRMHINIVYDFNDGLYKIMPDHECF